MNGLDWLQLGLKATWVVFAFAFGACAGSLINVLVYRLPRGLDAIWTPSQCPACETKLTWRENIPVLGWLFLGGRCRFCRSKISAEYPLVEALVGLLWAAMFIIYFALPQHAMMLGVDITAIRPVWARYDADVHGWPRETWPIFVVHLFAVASLVAMTLVDAKTFTIPLVLPWAAAAVGIVFHTIGATFTETSHHRGLVDFAPHAIWAIPTPGWSLMGPHGTGWWWIGASLGGVVGLVVGNVFLHFRWIRRSFEDYPAWELAALKAQGIDPEAPPPAEQVDEGVPVGEHVGPGVRLVLRFVLVWLMVALGLGVAGFYLGPTFRWSTWIGLAVGAGFGPLVAALACRSLAPQAPAANAPPPPPPTVAPTEETSASASSASPPSPSQAPPASPPSAPELWIAYPHARREMFKELLFLTPCLALMWLGGSLAVRFGLGSIPPLWLAVLCGTLMGGLIGGGAIWIIRIGGSLGFGKEAMGLGDVHLMAGIGACLGWIDAVLAIPLAAVVGMYFFFISIIAGRPGGRTMPFGPYLAVGTLLVLFGKPLVELGLTQMLGIVPPDSAINLP